MDELEAEALLLESPLLPLPARRSLEGVGWAARPVDEVFEGGRESPLLSLLERSSADTLAF